MGCGISKPIDRENNLPSQAYNSLSGLERYMLTLIYQDLASRNAYYKLDYETFQLFFNKHGLWAEKIFKQFDLNDQTLLSENQFIGGIARLSKSSEGEKARLLFSHFQSGSQSQGSAGISYKDFVRILYNYPKKDLNQILQDQYFFEEKIKKKLVKTKQSFDMTVSNVPEHQTAVYGLIEDDIDFQSIYDQSCVMKRTLSGKEVQVQNRFNASLTFFLYNKKLNVKMTSIHSLVKKYAELIFSQFSIHIKTGKINEENFLKWVHQHTKLYKNFYNGFHDNIWSQENGKPKYLNEQPEVFSQAKMWVEGVTQHHGEKVQLRDTKGMLIITEINKRQKPINIIYLQGLAVTQIAEHGKGTGFKISHPNEIYKEKKFFFVNPETTKKWMQALFYYKGITIFTDFTFGKRIGAGKFSTVYDTIEIKTNNHFAVKEIQTYKLSDDAKSILKNQSKILQVLDHPVLPKFYRVYHTKTHTHIVMELVKGVDLFEYIRQKGKISQIEAVPIVKRIVKGVKYLQMLGIVHRDLKPDNIIMVDNSKSKVKIIDFGFATYIADLKMKEDQCHEAVGTPNFIAPQMLGENIQITGKCDNFSIGSIVYYILSGTLPFLADDILRVFEKTRQGEYDITSGIWKKISHNAKSFINSLLAVDPHKRMELTEALQHPWLTQTIIPEIQQIHPAKNKKCELSGAMIF